MHQAWNTKTDMQQRTYLIGKHISSSLDGHNMGVIGEHSEQHGTVVLSWCREKNVSMRPDCDRLWLFRNKLISVISAKDIYMNF